MNKNLVNAVECARIITEKYNRKVDRSYITRLANNGRITYEIIDGKKLFDPDLIVDLLPKERLTASKVEDWNKQEEKKTLPIEKDLINYFKIQGLKFNDKENDNVFLAIQKPSVIDVKKELSILDLTEEEQAQVTEELIQNTINDINPKNIELNDIWMRFMSAKEEDEYKKEFNTFVDGFTESQITYIKFLLLNGFSSPELAANCVGGNLV